MFLLMKGKSQGPDRNPKSWRWTVPLALLAYLLFVVGLPVLARLYWR